MTGSAKQSIVPQKERMDCFVARAPRNDGGSSLPKITRRQFDRSAVRGAVGGIIPGIAIAVQRFGRSYAFRGNEVLQRCEPMPVIGLAGVGIAASLGALDLFGERGRPFVPGEQSAL